MFGLFTTDPVVIVTMALCLATIGLVLRLLRRFQSRRIRFLLFVLGFLCVLHGLRTLQEKVGLVTGRFALLEDVVDLVVIGLCLVSVLTLGLLSREHNRTWFHLRLFEAEEQPAPDSRVTAKPAPTTG